ncbi:MAG: HD domain-containing protein [Sulfurimonas sp.]|uniref:HD domain-containing phosphohydrolase n=1 Tax=Sulfurimonas sp. TaxID=2022749 RepID=UPI0026211E48|nr:HD domain-containing phosphohydrolase [Sulfurimonas sp.]MDD5372185.1 HD domain-containing protein [Sulfurimonas sp.]
MPYAIKGIEWRRIFDSAPDPIFLHDEEFRLMLANNAYLECAGITEEEAIGKLYWEVFPKGIGPMESCLKAVDGHKEEEEEEEIYLPDGRVFLSRSVSIVDKAGNYRFNRHNLTDITAITQAQEHIAQLNRLYRMISLGNQALVRANDEISLAQVMCDVLVEHGGYTTAWVGLKGDCSEKTIHPIAAKGIDISRIRSLNLTWEDNELGQAPTGTCIRTEKPVHRRNLPSEVPNSLLPITLELNVVESFSLPLSYAGRVLGALTVSSPGHSKLGEREIDLLTEMSGDLAFGIGKLRENAERLSILERLDKSLDHAVTAIAATVEMRDPYTAGHQRRVSELAAAIASEMGLSDEQIDAVRVSGVVHDIGKIHVPAEILSSPAKLSDAEFSIIKTHPQAGYDILYTIDFPWPVAQIVLQHHEKMDGSGYPNGLKEEDILIEARILCIADVIEAMASHRPYRPGFGIFPALQEISRNKGRLYDQNAVKATLSLFLEKGYEL